MIGDLLHGLDLHGEVKPINDVRRRLGERPWKPLHDLCAIRKNRDLAAPRKSL